MACLSVQTGRGFLAGALAHVDCQAQTIGSYGFASLAAPGSPVSLALTSLLTIFIITLSIRMLVGSQVGGRDVVGDVLKVGIVLTLATSWPAWRILGYDLLIHGPGQIAHVIAAKAGLPGSSGDIFSRLQNLDNGLATFSVMGSGRLGVAQGDWFQLGLARSIFLTGTLIPLALLRLTAGLLLAVAPLMAGTLLFGVSRGIFEGWARGLFAVFLGSIMLLLVYGVELALIEPWLQDALRQRASSAQTLDAPVEVVVLTLSFSLVALGTLVVLGKIAFHNTSPTSAQIMLREHRSEHANLPMRERAERRDMLPSRASVMANRMTETLRREERIADIMKIGESRRSSPSAISNSETGAMRTRSNGNETALGNAWRKPSRRFSSAANRRDGK